MRASSHRFGLLIVSLAAVAWSTTGLFTRVLNLDAPTMLAWRGLFGALGLLSYMAIADRPALAGFRHLGRPGLAYALISGLGMICFITSLRYTSVAHNSVIYAAVPFIAAGLGWVAMREKPGMGASMASAAALVGVIIMVGWGHDGGLIGDILALLMTIGMGLMMVLARRFPAIPTLPAATLSALLSALAAFPFSHALSVPLADMPVLAAFGLVNSALGLTLFLVGSRHLPPIESALITSLDAPLAPLWVWLFFAETPSLATMVGGGIVLVAVLIHIARESRRAALS